MGTTTIKNHYFFFGLGGSLLIFTIMLLAWKSAHKIDIAFNRPSKTVEESDFKLGKFTSRQFDQSGTLLYELNAESLTHYTVSQTAYLREPKVNFYNDTQSPWIATSKSGLIKEHEEAIILEGNVKINQQPAQTSAATPSTGHHQWEIESQQLTLFPKLNILMTDHPVLIASQTMRIRAIGLKANIKQHYITLRNNVRGTHRSK